MTQAAIACAVSDPTIRRAIERGYLKARRIGQRGTVLDFKEVAMWGAMRRLAAVGMLTDERGTLIDFDAIAG